MTVEIADGLIDESSKRKLKENLEQYEQLFRADEDAFDQPTTTRKELCSYYLYYNVRLFDQILPVSLTDEIQSDNGVGPGSYSQALFQSALSGAGWDPAVTPIQKAIAQLEAVSSPGAQEPDRWRASCSLPMGSALPS